MAFKRLVGRFDRRQIRCAAPQRCARCGTSAKGPNPVSEGKATQWKATRHEMLTWKCPPFYFDCDWDGLYLFEIISSIPLQAQWSRYHSTESFVNKYLSYYCRLILINPNVLLFYFSIHITCVIHMSWDIVVSKVTFIMKNPVCTRYNESFTTSYFSRFMFIRLKETLHRQSSTCHG